MSVKQRGDTIVEVLIAVAVVSSVLALAYSSMNKNLLLTRDSQERTEATKIAQGQIELFRAYREAGAPTYTGTFCLSGASATAITGFASGYPTAGLPDDFTKYPSTPPNTCKNGLYNYAIVTGVGASAGNYTFYVRWEKVSGSGQDQVIMVYR